MSSRTILIFNFKSGIYLYNCTAKAKRTAELFSQIELIIIKMYYSNENAKRALIQEMLTQILACRFKLQETEIGAFYH